MCKVGEKRGGREKSLYSGRDRRCGAERREKKRLDGEEILGIKR